MGLIHWWRERQLAKAEERGETERPDRALLTDDPRGVGSYADSDRGTYEGPAHGHRM